MLSDLTLNFLINTWLRSVVINPKRKHEYKLYKPTINNTDPTDLLLRNSRNANKINKSVWM